MGGQLHCRQPVSEISLFYFLFMFVGCSVCLFTWSIASCLQTGIIVAGLPKSPYQILFASVTLTGRDNNKVIKEEGHCKEKDKRDN